METNKKEIVFKVAAKGGVSVYGLGRFPTTLYADQWDRLLDAAPQLREFLEQERLAGHLKSLETVRR